MPYHVPSANFPVVYELLSITCTGIFFIRYLPFRVFSFDFTVITAFPFFFAVITPFESILTLLEFEEKFTGQYTPSGLTEALSVFFSPDFNLRFVALTVNLEGYKFLTLIVTFVFIFLFFLTKTVILTVPFLNPVTTPLEFTFAIFLLFEENFSKFELIPFAYSLVEPFMSITLLATVDLIGSLPFLVAA